MLTLESRLNQLLNDTFNAFEWPHRDTASATWTPVVDVADYSDRVLIHFEIPGVRPADVKVSVEDNTLLISGTKEQASFERSFKVPATVDATAIKAAQENGVLTVTLPKVEKAKPRQIQVEVSKR